MKKEYASATTAKMMGNAMTSLRWRWISLIKSRIVMSTNLYRTEP